MRVIFEEHEMHMRQRAPAQSLQDLVVLGQAFMGFSWGCESDGPGAGIGVRVLAAPLAHVANSMRSAARPHRVGMGVEDGMTRGYEDKVPGELK